MLKDAGELHFSTIQGTVQVGKLQSDSYIVNKNSQQIMNGVFIPQIKLSFHQDAKIHLQKRQDTTRNTNTAIVFSSDGEEDNGQNHTQAEDNNASLVIKMTNQKTTRQGPIYQVMNNNS